MPHEQTTATDAVAPDTPAPAAQELADQPLAEEGWPDETEDLPRRPRRRLLTPISAALLIVLLTA